MFSFKSALVLFSLFAFSYANVEEEEDVLVLTDDNFEAVIAEHPALLVEFYAPWCGHCKSLAPEYAKAASTLKAQDPPIRIAKVDATAQTKVGEKYGIKGFPTLKLFRQSLEPSDVSDYDGGRTADAIVTWINKKSGPAVQIIETVAELDALKEKNEVVIVAYLNDVSGDNHKAFEGVASKDDLNVYVATSNSALVSASGKAAPHVMLFKQFDEGQNAFSGAFNQNELSDFVKENSMPLVVTFSQESASKIFGGDIKVHVLVFSNEEESYHGDVMDAAKAAAKENKGKLLHVYVPLSEERILDYFNLKEADLPAVMLVNMEKGMKKYAFATQAEALKNSLSTFGKDLLDFQASYFKGTLKPSLKSAEPVDDADEAVKIIVGKDFQSRVVDSDQDVFLEFYAPWCGHCKSLAPKYEELAERFSDVSSILIAKMDATENEVDHPGVDVSGFPTIIFFPANDKSNPVVYSGDRDVNGMEKYLKENAKKFELEGESHGVDHDEL
jgi:protein disulfide-isomerase A1